MFSRPEKRPFNLGAWRRKRLIRGKYANLNIGVGREHDQERDYEIALQSRSFGAFLRATAAELAQVPGMKRLRFILPERDTNVTIAMTTITCSFRASTGTSEAKTPRSNESQAVFHSPAEEMVPPRRLVEYVEWISTRIDSAADLFAELKKGGSIDGGFAVFDSVRALIWLGLLAQIDAREIASQAAKFNPALESAPLESFLLNYKAG